MTEQTPIEGPEDPVQATIQASQDSRPPGLMFVLTMLIVAFALFTWCFNATCQSDGCMGVVIPLGGTWILTAIQLLVALPIHAARCMKRDADMGRTAAVLIIVSLAAAVIAGVIAL